MLLCCPSPSEFIYFSPEHNSMCNEPQAPSGRSVCLASRLLPKKSPLSKAGRWHHCHLSCREKSNSLGLTKATDLWSLLLTTGCSLLSADGQLSTQGGFRAPNPHKISRKRGVLVSHSPSHVLKQAIVSPTPTTAWVIF